MSDDTPQHPVQEQLSELFGSYKAEWLRERIFDFFTEPAYFPELTTARPCMLVGGRGTGKTTVLRGLSYEGQFVLRGRDAGTIGTWPYYGFYYRVNTNRVTAFKGPELSEQEWTRLFAHYLNTVLCDLVIRFLGWYHLLTARDTALLSTESCTKLATTLHLPHSETLRQLADNLEAARLRFEAYINNVADEPKPPLSMQGAPLDVLFEALASSPEFRGRSFFFLLDEYENFEDYQQQVVNSLIKHSQLYTFKVGVRELGWRRRTTLNENEQLISPADYVRINIAEKLSGQVFRDFARAVCNSRIARLSVPDMPAPSDITSYLPDLPEDEEAKLLGVSDHVQNVVGELRSQVSPDELEVLGRLQPLQVYLLEYWARSSDQPLVSVYADFVANRQRWDVRYSNYKHVLLYTLKSGKRGIRKYYAGWDVFVQLAASNVRYVLELVEQSLLRHLGGGGTLEHPVGPDTQTLAAQAVGRKNLSELEGLTVYGAQLTKLLLGLGRVFQVMAEQPLGHTPEANQFHLTDGQQVGGTDGDEVDRLLRLAVMHLALLRAPGNKLADEGDTREYDYMIHPLYAPFFVFSHRRKRKIAVSPAQIVGLVRRPRDTIREILRQNNRLPDGTLPEQLLLFEAYYSANS